MGEIIQESINFFKERNMEGYLSKIESITAILKETNPWVESESYISFQLPRSQITQCFMKVEKGLTLKHLLKEIISLAEESLKGCESHLVNLLKPVWLDNSSPKSDANIVSELVHTDETFFTDLPIKDPKVVAITEECEGFRDDML